MKVTLNKKVIAAVVITTVILTGLFIIGSADGTTPGSEADPVVTQSYVEQRADQTKLYIDTVVADLKAQLTQKDAEIKDLQQKLSQVSAGNGSTGGMAPLEAVKVTKGKTVLTGAGTELILRSGSATAVKGVGGGLADVTKGKDLLSGESVVSNHFLISARDDGRGIKMTVDGFIMVRGSYTIK